MSRWKDTLASLDRLLFPPCCLACHGATESAADVLCPDCRDKLVPIRGKYCRKCGALLDGYRCYACSQTDFSFTFARSALVYQSPVQELVHSLKYSELRSPASFFAKAMLDTPSRVRFAEKYDFVMAVPLHRVRQRERGCNQSELIARRIARELGLPCEKPVFRRYYTESQTNLSWERRKDNLKDAFGVRRNAELADKSIILVDDVFTSGTTVNEIARVLKANGARKVAVLTASRAV